MTHSHYEERLEADLQQIRDRVVAVSQRIEHALEQSVTALVHQDKALANRTILGDLSINRAIMEIDRLCHAFVARHLPSAGHLRFISSVMRMNVELERIGDYAVTICRETVQLSEPVEALLLREAERIAKDSIQMFEQAVRAFAESNAELARATIGYADQIDRSFANIFEELVEEGQEKKRTVRDLFGTLVIFNRLERVSDQAKNICEETIFAVTGETKPPKVYRILFVDETNACRSQMAAAIARKAYPNSGVYSSAGRAPAKALDPRLIDFMDARGIGLDAQKPRGIEEISDSLGDFHVIVSLEGPIERYLPKVPFRTVVLEWDVPTPPPPGADPAEASARMEEIYKAIANEVRELMETLRGEEAS